MIGPHGVKEVLQLDQLTSELQPPNKVTVCHQRVNGSAGGLWRISQIKRWVFK